MNKDPQLDNFHYQVYQPDDSHSKIVGSGKEPIAEETTDSISSVLRKEIEGKIVISNSPIPKKYLDDKDSLGESFVDAKEELTSGTSVIHLLWML